MEYASASDDPMDIEFDGDGGAYDAREVARTQDKTPDYQLSSDEEARSCGEEGARKRGTATTRRLKPLHTVARGSDVQPASFDGKEVVLVDIGRMSRTKVLELLSRYR